MAKQFLVVAQQFMRAQQQLREVDEATAFAHFLVGLVQGNLLASIRVALIIEMLWP